MQFKNFIFELTQLDFNCLRTAWSKGTKNWFAIQNQLVQLFGDRVFKYYEDKIE